VAVINGTNGDDDLEGTTNNDTIYGKNGADILYGLGGNDSLETGAGDDLAFGGDGNDNLYGKGGLDFLYGEGGNDSLYGDDYADVLYGGSGNDVLKGGLGQASLYGESGNDSVYYNPSKGKLEDLEATNELASSYLNGGGGKDVLNLFNDTTFKDANGKTQHSKTYIYLDDGGDGHQYFVGAGPDYNDPFVETGTFSQFEEIKVEGKGGLEFYGSWADSYGIKVTGTDTGDYFSSYYSKDTFLGGGGNDTFFFGGGDTIESWTKDADQFYFNAWYGYDTAHLTGFNGAGKDGGDELYIHGYDLANPSTQIVESGGKTTFTLNGGTDVLEINTTGLVQGEDWFLI
jgi:RTX calcium-binding nonapeptide repeat (4 copies)